MDLIDLGTIIGIHTVGWLVIRYVIMGDPCHGKN